MEDTISFNIAYLYKRFLAYSTKKLKAIGINYGEIPFIIYIGKKNGCTPGEMKESLKMDWGHSQRVIDRLLKNDIVFKKYDINDKRVCHLYLTMKGEEAFKVSHEVFKSFDKECLNSLSDDERITLLSLLNKLK